VTKRPAAPPLGATGEYWGFGSTDGEGFVLGLSVGFGESEGVEVAVGSGVGVGVGVAETEGSEVGDALVDV
jgi:hypothetical protein